MSTTPLPSDTKLTLWKRILAALGGTPKDTDPTRITLVKILNAVNT